MCCLICGDWLFVLILCCGCLLGWGDCGGLDCTCFVVPFSWIWVAVWACIVAFRRVCVLSFWFGFLWRLVVSCVSVASDFHLRSGCVGLVAFVAWRLLVVLGSCFVCYRFAVVLLSSLLICLLIVLGLPLLVI